MRCWNIEPDRVLVNRLVSRSRALNTQLKSLLFVCLCLVGAESTHAQETFDQEQGYDETSVRFVNLLFADGAELQDHLDFISDSWQPGYEAMALDIMRLARRSEVISSLFELLRRETGEATENSTRDWFRWLWNRPEQKYAHYAEFKSLLYRLIDPVFEGYFDEHRATTIRLDEVVWGGVQQDGIPPLRRPKMIPVEEASYLDEDNVVFGIEINGDARAYPKRILAWHEMFVDEIGGVEFAGVYCTLCGAVILYETTFDNTRHELGTSGFLYRSNKLMYDRETQSLWNTTWGQPVIGPLVGQGIELKRSYVVNDYLE